MNLEIETKFIHAGYEPDINGAVIPSITLSTTYLHHNQVGNSEHEYIRCSNPTRNILEKCMAECESGMFAIAFSSGISAVQSILSIIESPKILAIDDLYGGIGRLMNNMKLDVTFNSFENLLEIETIIEQKQINIIWIESPTNPLLKTVNISEIAQLKKSALLVVDNTFATPYLQNPLTLGSDIVIHSATKYINGHTDVLMGFTVTNHYELYDKMKKFQWQMNGAVPSPFDCYLTLRGLKTLHVRVQRQSENSYHIYEFLKKYQNKTVGKIYYPPALKNNLHGGMISFELLKDPEFIRNLPSKLSIIRVAESLGSVETLLCVPHLMTHASVPLEHRLKIGITDQLIRISVGIENVDDLINDLTNILS